jgi:hypothetical protein
LFDPHTTPRNTCSEHSRQDSVIFGRGRLTILVERSGLS